MLVLQQGAEQARGRTGQSGGDVQPCEGAVRLHRMIGEREHGLDRITQVDGLQHAASHVLVRPHVAAQLCGIAHRGIAQRAGTACRRRHGNALHHVGEHAGLAGIQLGGV